MLGEGGFGEVFWCRLTVGESARETAVKVLNKVVSADSIARRPFVIECCHGDRVGVAPCH